MTSHSLFRRMAGVAVALVLLTGTAQAQDTKPNIVVIWGDDIGQFNISAYNNGMMGYRTPNIDSIADDGALFTDWYGQQSCTAGRAAFITGQSPIRTGLLKIGLPGSPEGINVLDPTIADLLKPLGYTSGQFGKNHLGDRDEMLPTNHGFDVFFGNLYHLNAEEEPENDDYPAEMLMPDGRTFKDTFGPRGVIYSVANPDGTQTVEDTGPLTQKRMETIDEEVTSRALAWMDQAHASGKPMFLWYNTTRMHIFTHLKEASQGVTGLGVYPDGMVEHDGMVGQILQKIKDLGIEDNTIVMYSTDNGAETFSWPDGGTTQFKSEKNSPWEGGYRVPTLIKWPGVIKPGSVYNEIGAHEDMLPTLLAAAGDPGVIDELAKGETINGRDYKVHLDGSDLRPAFEGKGDWPRKSFIYWTDGGDIAALRYGNWNAQYLDQPAHGLGVWQEPFVTLRAPILTNLRTDPFEKARDEDAMGYQRWYVERMYMFIPAMAYLTQWMQSFKEFPIRMKPGSFDLQSAMDAMTGAANGP